MPLTRHALLTLTLMALAAPMPASSMNSCPGITPEASVTFAPALLNRSATLSGLARMSGTPAGGAGGHSGHSFVTGLYVPKLQTSIRYGLSIETNPLTGAATACLSTLSIALATESTIYLAAEIPNGGCAETAIYLHEYHHYEIQYHQTQQASARFFAINALPTVPFRAANADQVKASADAYAQAYMRQLGQSAINFVEPKQREFDSAEEYARVSHLCSAEMGPILRRHAGQP